METNRSKINVHKLDNQKTRDALQSTIPESTQNDNQAVKHNCCSIQTSVCLKKKITLKK